MITAARGRRIHSTPRQEPELVRDVWAVRMEVDAEVVRTETHAEVEARGTERHDDDHEDDERDHQGGSVHLTPFLSSRTLLLYAENAGKATAYV